ncbi:MAG: hypothetical protein WAU07_02260, partial [Microgenomates group bacterium]
MNARFGNAISRLLFFLALVCVISGSLGLVYVQKPLRETQNIQPEASVDVGLVTVSSRSTTGAISQGQPTSVILSVNTASAQIYGVQLVFNIVTDTTDNFGIRVLENSGLKTAFLETERTSDGYLVGVVALPQVESSGYSTFSATDFLEIQFTPHHGGTVELNFDVEESFASLFASDPLKDELTHIENITFYVSGEPVSVTGNTQTATQPPPHDSNSIAQCNELCSDNSQCPVNHRCVDISGTNRCRLATNISSEICSTKITVESQPISAPAQFAQCNEACTYHSECAAGNVCYLGSCRQAAFPDSVTCENPSESVLLAISQSCNMACLDNSECGANMNCFSGICRLATNKSSVTCSPGLAGSVSAMYGTSKGGSISEQHLDTGANNQAGIQSGISDELQTGQVTSALDEVAPDETVWGMLKAMLTSKEFSLPLLVLFAGAW